MTTVRQATRRHAAPARRPAVPGGLARTERRRLIREEFLAVLVLAVLLAVVLVMLGMQWLDTGATTSAPPLHPAHHPVRPTFGGFA
jgi:hypothetical protein